MRFNNSELLGIEGHISRCRIVDDFIGAINVHREIFFGRYKLICVDESMSRWYGLGGEWLDT